MRTLFYTLLITALLNSSPLMAKGNNGKGKGHGGMPPGLQKKFNNGQGLPPGWQKKLARGSILDLQVFKLGKIIVPLDPLGILTIKVDNRILRIDKKTRKIIKILQ